MQTYRLTVDKFLDHAAKWFGDRELVEADAGRVVARTTYAELRERSNRLSGALAALGLQLGDRVGTLAWNTRHHLEVYYAAMGMGAVCHTLNPRLTVDHLAQIVNEAENRVLAVAASLLPLAQQLLPRCPTIEQIVVLDEPPPVASTRADIPVWPIETLLAEKGAPVVWGAFDEETPAGLCYTSGTTGKPKGVLYTHRSNYLHTLRALQADATALTARDTLLLAVPMFHANGWGFPFAAPAVGAKLVLPGRTTDGPSLTRLLRDENVTAAVGVYTVWLGVLDQLDRDGGELPALERVMIGGSTCPDAFIRRLEDRLGAEVQTSWGMTEISPIGTVAPRGAARAEVNSGRPTMGLDLKLTDADGVTLPQQRGVVGHLRVKGAAVVDRYFKATSDALDEEGYFDTGDLAMIDDAGNLSLCGRSKDLIKSGGEWINPTEIEVIAGRHPAVGAAAVIGRPDEKWGERPVLIVEPRQGHELDTEELLGSLRGKLVEWWLPDEIAQVQSMPLAATGKIDKQRLRADYASGRIGGRSVRR
ncbi:MAG: AMP-dependent synthetase [Gemmatimonadetes bacterium]|nr:MAG: AMP-dependent synthetase [Gemmatimonadota bacterium]